MKRSPYMAEKCVIFASDSLLYLIFDMITYDMYLLCLNDRCYRNLAYCLMHSCCCLMVKNCHNVHTTILYFDYCLANSNQSAKIEKMKTVIKRNASCSPTTLLVLKCYHLLSGYPSKHILETYPSF